MAFEIVRQPYEILIRWSGGVVSGAHWRELEIGRDGPVVYFTRELDPVPLALGGAPMTAALGEVSAGLSAQVLALQNQVAQLQEIIDGMSSSRAGDLEV
jgi:hypothetical protein